MTSTTSTTAAPWYFQVHPAEARAGLEKRGHADSTWSCVNGLQDPEVSMSTSLLYHAFGIRGYEYIRTDHRGGQTLFTIHQDPDDCRCSACGSRAVISRGHCERQLLALPIGSRKTIVVLPIPRVECRACGLVRQVEVPFAEPRRSVNDRLTRLYSAQQDAVHRSTGWDWICV